MSWLLRYRIRHYFINSIWIFPVIGMVVGLLTARLLLRIDLLMGWTLDRNPETIESMLGTLSAAVFTLIVFVSSSLLVSIQLASSQLTPRIIGFAFRDRVTKFALTSFVFTFALSLSVLIRIQTYIPLLSVKCAAYSCLICLGIFLYQMNHLGRFFRPGGVFRAVALQGRKVIESTYPLLLTPLSKPSPATAPNLAQTPKSIVMSTKSGVILTVDLRMIVSMAQQANCIIEMVPRIGDYVAAGDLLFRIYSDEGSINPKDFHQLVVLGLERTLEHDPALAFRIIVDIAGKALSPAINDPTTAVLAIDQIHSLLRNVGMRNLESGYLRDTSGQVRLFLPTPDWEDYVRVSVTEIRHWGAGSIQVVRRLRNMLDNLIQTLPEERAVLLRSEMNLLHREVQNCLKEPEDQAWALGTRPGFSVAAKKLS